MHQWNAHEPPIRQIPNTNVREILLIEHIETCGQNVFLIFPFPKLHDTSEFGSMINENRFIKTYKLVLNGNNNNNIPPS